MHTARTARWILFALAGFALAILLLIGCIHYFNHWRIRDIDISTSPDSEYRILFQSVGSPKQPSGASPARLELRNGRKTIAAHRIDVANGGVSLHPSNWRTDWQEDHVSVLVTGDDARHDILCTFGFDGSVQTRELEDRWVSFAELDMSGQTIPDYASLSYENEKGESAFALSPDQFVTHFNSVWQKDHDRPYLASPDSDGWIRFPEPSPRFGYAAELHWYSEDRTIRSLPTVSLYAAEDGTALFEIRLTFDDHGFRENLYQEYRELCVCLFRTACPALSEADACRLFDSLFETADRDFFGDHTSFGDPCRPELSELFRIDRIGFYSFYGSGNIEICMIPLTESALRELQACGTEITGRDP